MVFRGFIAVEDGVLRMAVRGFGVMRRQRVILSVPVPGGFVMISRRPLVVVGRGSVMLRTTEFAFGGSGDFKGRRGKA
jgi:hypothetical protein